MKSTLILYFLFWLSIGYSQNLTTQLIPIDSSGYIKLITPNGEDYTTWKELEDVNIDLYHQLIIIKKNGNWAIGDSILEPLTEFKFDTITKHKEYILAQNTSNLIVYNSDLDTILNVPQFIQIKFRPDYLSKQSLYKNCDSLAIIETQSGSGIVDYNFNWIINPKFDNAFFMDNIIYTRVGDKFGFITVNHNEVEAKWTTIGAFNNDVIEVTDNKNHRRYILKNGELIPDSDSTLVFIPNYWMYKVYKNGKATLLSNTLDEVINYNGIDIFPIRSGGERSYGVSDNLYQEYLQYAIKVDSLIGVIDGNNTVIIPPVYEHIDYAINDLYIAVKQDKFGVIDKNNEIIIPFDFTFITVEKNLFKVYNYKKMGVLNQKGDTIVPVKFNEIRLWNGIITKLNGRHGFYNYEGKEILTPYYLSVINNNGGLEFVSPKGRCMVNQNERLTPLYCSKITKSHDKIKYYTGNKIVIKTLENEIVIDSTIYQVAKAVHIQNRWKKNTEVHVGEPKFVEFTNQMNGKIGTKRKTDINYGVEPIYFNVFNIYGSRLVKQRNYNLIELDKSYINVKETGQIFYENSSNLGKSFISISSNQNRFRWQTRELTPIITPNNESRFLSRNKFTSPEFTYIKERQLDLVTIIKEGELNYDSGIDLMSFRDYYATSNSAFTYHITSSIEFDNLSTSAMIKIEQPLIEVQNVKYNPHGAYFKFGTYLEFKKLNSGFIFVETQSNEYGIISTKGDSIVPFSKNRIQIITHNEFEFYLRLENIESIDGTTEVKWVLYNYSGQLLSGKFDSIKVITENAFKVTQNGNDILIDKKGKVIYRY